MLGLLGASGSSAILVQRKIRKSDFGIRRILEFQRAAGTGTVAIWL
jgi:hypothetical protein